jgi:hypothetical protein
MQDLPLHRSRATVGRDFPDPKSRNYPADSGGNNQRKMVRSRHPPTAGEIALKSSQPDGVKAEVCFGQALAVARQQEANSWELRAAASMARLWRDQGKPQQARELLAPVYDWFTEGFNTLDLQEAKALLDELRV